MEVVKRNDGTFDLFLDTQPYRSRIPEEWLPEEVCVRFGFCGGEYDSILREVHQSGRARVMVGER